MAKGNVEHANNLRAEADAIESGAKSKACKDKWQKDYYAPEVLEGWIYSDRNYNLFAILADVRNGYGFAGVYTGEGYNPIADPKGLPNDVSEYIRQQSDEWDCDAHSHSYHTLDDLLKYDWEQETISSGVVSENEYIEFKKTGTPVSWCGDVSGDSIIKVQKEEMDKIIAGEIMREHGKEYYTRIYWGTSYKKDAGYFYSNSIPMLQELAKKEGLTPEEVRIVFWFDN